MSLSSPRNLAQRSASSPRLSFCRKSDLSPRGSFGRLKGGAVTPRGNHIAVGPFLRVPIYNKWSPFESCLEKFNSNLSTDELRKLYNELLDCYNKVPDKTDPNLVEKYIKVREVRFLSRNNGFWDIDNAMNSDGEINVFMIESIMRKIETQALTGQAFYNHERLSSSCSIGYSSTDVYMSRLNKDDTLDYLMYAQLLLIKDHLDFAGKSMGQLLRKLDSIKKSIRRVRVVDNSRNRSVSRPLIPSYGLYATDDQPLTPRSTFREKLTRSLSLASQLNYGVKHRDRRKELQNCIFLFNSICKQQRVHQTEFGVVKKHLLNSVQDEADKLFIIAQCNNHAFIALTSEFRNWAALESSVQSALHLAKEKIKYKLVQRVLLELPTLRISSPDIFMQIVDACEFPQRSDNPFGFNGFIKQLSNTCFALCENMSSYFKAIKVLQVEKRKMSEDPDILKINRFKEFLDLHIPSPSSSTWSTPR